MSNDQIIRNTKPHEVTIPEGSNNARSIRNKVGQRDIEQDRDDKVSVSKHYADSTAHGESDAFSDRHAQADQGPQSGEDHRVAMDTPPDMDHRVAVQTPSQDAANLVKLPATDTRDSRATLPPPDERTDHRVTIPADGRDDNLARLPADGLSDHRATLPSGDQADHRVALDADASAAAHVPIDMPGQASHRATLQDDHHDSHSPAKEGGTSSQPVSIPSDSVQDSFATTPVMTNTESSPVKVDGHGITDPDRVIIDNAPDPLGQVPVPHAESQAPDPLPAHEAPSLAMAAVEPPAGVSAVGHASPAQVTVSLADKKAEEFRGRVVKLRGEVDQLNHRLDEFKK